VLEGREPHVRGHLREGSAIIHVNRFGRAHLGQIERELPHLPVRFPQMNAMRNHQKIG